MDFSSLRKLLIDEYRMEGPDLEQERAFLTALVKYEHYLSEAKDILLSEFSNRERSLEEVDAFITGLERFEECMFDDGLDERLNESFPYKVRYETLKRSIKDAVRIYEENETLRKKVRSLERVLDSSYKPSKAEIFEMKKQAEYKRLTERIELLEKGRAYFASKLLEKWCKEYK